MENEGSAFQSALRKAAHAQRAQPPVKGWINVRKALKSKGVLYKSRRMIWLLLLLSTGLIGYYLFNDSSTRQSTSSHTFFSLSSFVIYHAEEDTLGMQSASLTLHDTDMFAERQTGMMEDLSSVPDNVKGLSAHMPIHSSSSLVEYEEDDTLESAQENYLEPTTENENFDTTPLSLEKDKAAGLDREEMTILQEGVEQRPLLEFSQLKRENISITLPLMSRSLLVNQERVIYYSDVYFGSGLPSRHMVASSTELEPYLNLRNESESDISWIEAGWRLGIQVNRWLFDLGVQYGQINAFMQHTYNDYRRTVEVPTFDNSGQLIALDTMTRFGTRERIVRNTYREWSLPMRIGYKFLDRRVSLLAFIGIQPVFGLQPRGVILDQGLNDYNLAEDNLGWFDTGVRWQGMGYIQAELPFSSRLSCLIDAGAIVGFSGLHSGDNPIQQRYNMVRGSIGLRYYLGAQATSIQF